MGICFKSLTDYSYNNIAALTIAVTRQKIDDNLLLESNHEGNQFYNVTPLRNKVECEGFVRTIQAVSHVV